MNKRNLNKLAKALEEGTYKELGIKFDLGWWEEAKASFKPGSPACGTVACIGGTANLLLDKAHVVEKHYVPYDFEGDAPSGKGFKYLHWNGPVSEVKNARELLGLDYYTADELFFPDRHTYPGVYNISAKKAAKVIRNLVATGEVDWTVAGIKPKEYRL